MKHQIFSSISNELIKNQTIDISVLANKIGITEANLENHLYELTGAGFPVSIENNKKVRRLKIPFVPLCETEIWELLTDTERSKIERLTVHTSITSTNDFLKKTPDSQRGMHQVCVTEHQSEGRGRRGKNWVSPIGENLYFSIKRKLCIPIEMLGGISLIIGLAILKSLESLKINHLKLKWPNDIYYKDSKLGGILIESTNIQPEKSELVIGIGLNVNMSEENARDIQQPWAALCQSLTDPIVSRSLVIANTLSWVFRLLDECENTGTAPLLNEWKNHDYLTDQPVTISTSSDAKHAKACGINEKGELLVEIDNDIHAFQSGEVSVRRT